MTPNTKPKLDGFEFLEYLGGGTFGQVWKALDVKMQVLRAVKVLHKERFRECDAQRLLQEARTLAQLPKHRNRVAVHYLKDGITNTFLVMDYVSGGALSSQTLPERPLPWACAARYVAGAADALRDVHARGLLHRDIKPANVLWDPETDEAVLGDFGLSVSVDRAGRGAGTKGYIAPEVFRGAASPKSDVYSLAATLLHLVTGERARENALPADYSNWVSVPEELRQVILAGLESDPDRRADLPTFLGLLREARWQALCHRVLRQMPAPAGAVRLQAAVAIARAHDPETFFPLSPRGGPVLEVYTGDYVKVEAVASADGYHVVLVLGSSGELDIALPRPTEPYHRFAAGQRHSLLFRLTPPAGTERILILWSRERPTRTLPQWRHWLERVESGAEEGRRPAPMRGLEVLGSEPHAPPEGNWRALVIPVTHSESHAASP
jgi:hypothetical protein